MTFLKPHLEYFNFRCRMQLDLPVHNNIVEVLQQPRISSLHSIGRIASDRLEAGHGGRAGAPSAVSPAAEKESLFPSTQTVFRNLSTSPDGGGCRRRRRSGGHRARHGDPRGLDQQRRCRSLRGRGLLLLRSALPAARGLRVPIAADTAAARLSQSASVLA